MAVRALDGNAPKKGALPPLSTTIVEPATVLHSDSDALDFVYFISQLNADSGNRSIVETSLDKSTSSVYNLQQTATRENAGKSSTAPVRKPPATLSNPPVIPKEIALATVVALLISGQPFLGAEDIEKMVRTHHPALYDPSTTADTIQLQLMIAKKLREGVKFVASPAPASASDIQVFGSTRRPVPPITQKISSHYGQNTAPMTKKLQLHTYKPPEADESTSKKGISKKRMASAVSSWTTLSAGDFVNKQKRKKTSATLDNSVETLPEPRAA